ncbi:NUDIX domain-containing protein [Mycoplasma buteonis]|uniref:NUDIX domain-containing protein n=1 Tax=Mycoplasma buteonis TaxID=171280 RepID=UPI00055E7271|nr:NUDIX domain-containing protein [Mycoplasma buteonis]
MQHEISCGCVVFKEFSTGTKVLLIKQINKNWTFPKGHQEKGENLLTTAIRELQEETSIKKDFNLTIYPEYHYQMNYVLPNLNTKEVIFFLAQYTGSSNPIKQESELLKAGFYPVNRAKNLLTFNSGKRILKQAYQDYLKVQKQGK